MEHETLLTTQAAAERLSIGKTKIYELIGAGELPTIRIGRAVRVPASAVQDWIGRHLTQAGNGRDAA